MKNNKNLSKNSIVIIIFLLIFSFVIVGIAYKNTLDNNIPSTIPPIVEDYEYDKLNIDKSKLNIFYFSVGSADSILILLEDNVMLIDAGNVGDGDNIVQFLKAQGLNKIDYLIGTHVDNDHIGGMHKIINNIFVQNLYIPKYENNDRNAYNKIISSINKNSNINLKLDSLTSNETIHFGEAYFKVLAAQTMEDINNDINKINDTSVVLQLNYKDRKYLFTGDMQEKLEKQLLLESGDNILEKIDVLKVVHHGADNGTTKDFLGRVSPKYAIISSGSDDTKHPNEDCLKRLLLDIETENVYITERDGTIWQISDGESEDIFIKMYDINLDGNGNIINSGELNIEYLESIQDEYAFFYSNYCKKYKR